MIGVPIDELPMQKKIISNGHKLVDFCYILSKVGTAKSIQDEIASVIQQEGRNSTNIDNLFNKINYGFLFLELKPRLWSYPYSKDRLDVKKLIADLKQCDVAEVSTNSGAKEAANVLLTFRMAMFSNGTSKPAQTGFEFETTTVSQYATTVFDPNSRNLSKRTSAEAGLDDTNDTMLSKRTQTEESDHMSLLLQAAEITGESITDSETKAASGHSNNTLFETATSKTALLLPESITSDIIVPHIRSPDSSKYLDQCIRESLDFINGGYLPLDAELFSAITAAYCSPSVIPPSPCWNFTSPANMAFRDGEMLFHLLDDDDALYQGL